MASKTKRRRFSFSRRRFSGRRSTKMTLPLSIVAGFVPVGVGIWNRRSSGTEIGNYLQAGFTGIGSDGRFSLANLKVGLLPVAAGFMVHKLAGKFGINRMLSQSGIPLVRI